MRRCGLGQRKRVNVVTFGVFPRTRTRFWGGYTYWSSDPSGEGFLFYKKFSVGRSPTFKRRRRRSRGSEALRQFTVDPTPAIMSTMVILNKDSDWDDWIFPVERKARSRDV